MYHNADFLRGCDPHQCRLNEAAEFHSMSNEDEAIYEIFYSNPHKCCRVVVEVGAGDGLRHSASRFFEDALNWRPLLIEANPEQHAQLVVNRQGNATIENGAFCESDHLVYDNGHFSSLGGSVEVSSEMHAPLRIGSNTSTEVPCLQMENVFAKHNITKVDVMVLRVSGDSLAFIRSMDWRVRVDIWVILMHGAQRAARDELVRNVLLNNEYVQAEWDIKRWCPENSQCLNNEVFLRKGFNPLPVDLRMFGMNPTTSTATTARRRNLRH